MSASHRSLACALAAALVVGCADRALTPTQPPVLSSGGLNSASSISDGAHGGNSHFLFLPPLVAQPAYKGTFDASLAPEVTICEWTGTACAAAAVASYTTTSGTGGEIVRVSSSEYAVNWDTDLGTTLGRTYRVRITVAGTEIGYSDVLLVTNGRDAKNLTTGDVVALVYGRILPLKFRIERGAVAVVGATGGTAVLADGAVALGFSPGAVSSAIGVTATPIAPGTPAAPDNSVLAGTQYEFQPSPTTFSQPVTLTLSYPATLPPKWHADRLVICKIVDDACQPLSGGSVNTQTRTVSATISGFSEYALRESPEVSYTGFANGVWSIFLHTANGERELAHDVSSYGAADQSWAPDGSRLAYARGGGCGGLCPTEIRIASADGSLPERSVLGPGPVAYYAPKWSPDGAWILVSSSDGGNLPPFYYPQIRFVVVRADGSEVRTFPEVDARMPWVDAVNWSPDGQRIFFQGPVDGTRNAICAINLDGTGFTELLSDFYAGKLFFSPDGSRIAIPDGGDPRGVSVLNVDGTGLHLAISGWLRFYGWSPEASANSLLFEDIAADVGEYTVRADYGLYTVGAVGALEHAVAGGWRVVEAGWSADGHRIWLIGWSPDGISSSLAIVNADGTSLQTLAVLGNSVSGLAWRP